MRLIGRQGGSPRRIELYVGAPSGTTNPLLEVSVGGGSFAATGITARQTSDGFVYSFDEQSQSTRYQVSATASSGRAIRSNVAVRSTTPIPGVVGFVSPSSGAATSRAPRLEWLRQGPPAPKSYLVFVWEDTTPLVAVERWIVEVTPGVVWTVGDPVAATFQRTAGSLSTGAGHLAAVYAVDAGSWAVSGSFVSFQTR